MIKVSVIRVIKYEPFRDKTMGDPSDSTFESRLKCSPLPSLIPRVSQPPFLTLKNVAPCNRFFGLKDHVQPEWRHHARCSNKSKMTG